ncbi:KAP family P-loop NTPase fold protein [Piscirickettsia litoralis]|uniref:KAP NTPase domain-containing protein n=1 Tax=Piscirickettsia litoralis TaxID=1891921 RepID=A0ABX2ZWV6_9GAMM|nr:P-loop NTPase fold protein [Piscirickettsia litoralis]ODN41112.1 hypothetical protein BGC07_17715 [Piscirickettsia litoralis]
MEVQQELEAKDTLERADLADKLINLIRSNIDLSPLLVDGFWGTGKTTLAELIKRNLDSSKSKYVYIDAFRFDHSRDPLGVLVGRIAESIEKKKGDTLVKAAIPAVKHSLRIAAKAGVSYLLRADCDEIAKEFQNAITEGLDQTVKSIIDGHREEESNIAALKEGLLKATEGQELIIIIDELDRCRPDFAVAMLEKIKHVFDIANVKFILIANSEQLITSIQHSYGSSLSEAGRYIDKFIKFTFKLPSQTKNNLHAVEVHIQSLLENDKNLEELSKEGYIFLLSKLIKTRQLSLRESEDLFRYLKIYCHLSGKPFKYPYYFSLIFIFSIYIHCFYSSFSQKILDGNATVDELYEILGMEYKHIEDTDTHRDKILHILAGCYIFALEDKPFEKKVEFHSDKWSDEVMKCFVSTSVYGIDDLKGIVQQPIKTLMLIG